MVARLTNLIFQKGLLLLDMRRKIIFFSILLLLFCIFAFPTKQVHAATLSMTIGSCELSGDGTTVNVTASLSEGSTSTSDEVYLLALDPYVATTESISIQPLASASIQNGTTSFQVTYTDSMLFQKFVIAVKADDLYTPISNSYYITNPEVLATYTEPNPQGTSKKGLQVEDYSESLELGTKHAVLNWTASMLLTDNASHGIPYEYQGTTYYFNPEIIECNDAMVAGYTKAGVRVTVILLLPNDNITVTTPMRYSGSETANYTSFNTYSAEGCQMFEAMMSFLAEHYSTKERLVSGWILGNEVNSPGIWNYAGDTDLNTYMQSYAQAFRICYNAVKSQNKYANVYISLDHNWNHDTDDASNGYFTTKSVLDTFYNTLNQQGQIVFQIAYHCYPQNLPTPTFWNDSLATASLDTTYLTFRNLNVLTDYVRSMYGERYTIMLSEQSFNSNKGEEVQAAAYAYAYYLCESNSMIEAFIYGRQYDHPIELAEGCSWGLSDSSHNRRLIWDVFQFIDTPYSQQFTESLLGYTNLTQWEQIIGYEKSKYQNMPSPLTQVYLSGAVSASTTSAELYWSEVAAADGYEVFRDDQLVATVTDPSVLGYVDTGLTTGMTYRYNVRAFAYVPAISVDSEQTVIYGDVSETKSVQVTTGESRWSSTPYAVMGNHIVLFWEPQEGVTGYEIFRSDSLDGTYTSIAVVASNSYDDTDTVSGKRYYYKVRAYANVNGVNYYGAESQPISAQSHIQLYGSCVGEAISLSWSAWPEADTYQIYYAPKGSDEFVLLQTLADLTFTTTPYTASPENPVTFDPNVTYQIKVCAVLADGKMSPDSNVIEVTYGQSLATNAEAVTTNAAIPNKQGKKPYHL